MKTTYAMMLTVVLCAGAGAVYAAPKTLTTRISVDDSSAVALGLNEGLLLAQAEASDAGEGPTISVGEPTIGTVSAPPAEVPIAAAKDLLDLVKNKKGTAGFAWLVVAAVLRLLVQLLRWVATIWPEKWGREGLVTFVQNPLVAYLMPVVVSTIGGVATSVAAGQGWFSADLLNTIITVAMGAIGLYVGERKIKEAMGAGKAAAATPGPTLNG